MAGFFADFSDFFLGIFSDPETRKLKKELKELHDRLAEYRPALYQKSNETVLPGFASAWFNLYQLFLPLFDLFSRTINSPDKKVRDLSLNFLVESGFLGDVAERRAVLTYEKIKARLDNSEDPSKETSKVNGEINSLLSDLRKQNGAVINAELAELFNLKNLVVHNFAGFFKRFGFDIALTGKASPRFVPVSGDDILPELLDLYYIIGKINLSAASEKGLFLLLERLAPGNAGENQKKMAKLLQKIRQLLTGPCSPMILLTLMRVLRRETRFVPEAGQAEENYVLTYLTELSQRLEKDRDRAVRELSESSMTKDIASLFGDADHLLKLETYSEETNELLAGAGLATFSHVKALRILKSFTQSVLHGGWLDGLKAVMLDAFFQDKEWGMKLSTAYYGAEKLLARIQAEDDALAAEGKLTLTALQKYLKARQSSPVANKIIEAIDRNILDFIETETNEIALLAAKTGEILMDFKTPQPKNISNIKGLGGKNNREIITSLLDGYNKSVLFLKLMRNFVVIKGFTPVKG